MHLCRLSKLYKSNARSARVDVQTLDDGAHCTKDSLLEISEDKVRRGVNDEHHVCALPTIYNVVKKSQLGFSDLFPNG